jgi:16S rRNA (uracil1498-N3)-methyltransferase
VGPEGGFAEEEIVQAEGAGWQVISLGSRILRAETASIAGVASLLTLAGEVGDLRSVTNVTDGRA